MRELAGVGEERNVPIVWPPPLSGQQITSASGVCLSGGGVRVGPSRMVLRGQCDLIIEHGQRKQQRHSSHTWCGLPLLPP